MIALVLSTWTVFSPSKVLVYPICRISHVKIRNSVRCLGV